MKSGLNKIYPHRQDLSLLHTFGATAFDTKGLPQSFSIYGGQPIPNQDLPDLRFSPQLPMLPFGCTGESGAFETGLQERATYNPKDLYDNTPPFTEGQGRDIRQMFNTLIDRGVQDQDLNMSPRRTAYFNCYGAGAIDDFDAARIALWINQEERRGVYVGSWWYPEFESPVNGVLPTPSFNTAQATMHCWLVVGWRDDMLECISWQGMDYGLAGVALVPRALFNALMAQPFTGAFTITKVGSGGGIPIGYTAIIDHLTYFIRNLFHV